MGHSSLQVGAHSEATFALMAMESYMQTLYDNHVFFDDDEEAPAPPPVETMSNKVANSPFKGVTLPQASLKPMLRIEEDGSLYAQAKTDGGDSAFVGIKATVVNELWFSNGQTPALDLLKTGVEGHYQVSLILSEPKQVKDVVIDNEGYITAAEIV